MKPSIGRIVHYQAYGTPGGEYKSVPRAAIITDVQPLDAGVANNPVSYADELNYRVSLCVLNPSGMFYNADVKYDPEAKAGGTWRWPPRE